MSGSVSKALSVLLLSAITGCASGPFHHRITPIVIAPAEAPELSQTPLYSPEMSEYNPTLPALPPAMKRPIVPEPVEVVQKPKRQKKTKPPAVTAKTPVATPARSGSATGVGDGSSNAAAATGASAVPPSTGAGTGTASSSSPVTPPAPEKKAPAQQASVAGSTPASLIGELTAGTPEDAAQTNQHTTDLIRSTHDGLDAIKRPLTTDEKKTVTEIWTFLNRAQQALKNGDGDGAMGLATKAKLLLDELTLQ